MGLPYSVEAEQSVIGGILLDPSGYQRVRGSIVEPDFFRSDNRLIYQTIVELESEANPYDVVTVAERLERNGKLEQVGGLSYIAALAENTVSAVNITAYAEVVKKRSLLRQLSTICKATQETIKNPQGKSADEILSETQTALDELNQDLGSEYYN